MNKIKKLYTDTSKAGSFAGLTTFKKNNQKFKIKDIKNSLSQLEAYTLHKKINRNFKRNRVFVPSIDDTWQIDLIDVSKLKNKKFRQYYNYMLTCIDCFSKKSWVIPILTKTAENCKQALDNIIEKSKRSPKRIYSDEGKEFLGAFQKYLKVKKIQQIFTKSKHKASIVERFNRTFKDKLYRAFTQQGNTNYMNILPSILDSYNNSYHRSIKTTPNLVTHKNEEEIFKNLYYDIFRQDTPLKVKYPVGSYVRKALVKKLFEKGYTPNWSKEVYVVVNIIPTNPVKYLIKHTEEKTYNKNLQFYEQELQQVSFEEYPYNTHEVIDENKEQFLVTKLNEDNSQKIWKDKKQKTDTTVAEQKETKIQTRSATKKIKNYV
jgi:transposase InsO family protein